MKVETRTAITSPLSLPDSIPGSWLESPSRSTRSTGSVLMEGVVWTGEHDDCPKILQSGAT